MRASAANDLSSTPSPSRAAASRDLEPEEESKVVVQAQAGSTIAFERLVQHYQSRLMRYLMVRGFNRADAEDVVQITFINAWTYLHSYRQEWRFSTWLFTIARRNLPSQRTETVTLDSADEVVALGDNAFDAKLRESVWSQARIALDPQAFDALWLHHGEGFTGREVARILNRSPIWVRVSLHRSRSRLKAMLNKEHAS